MGALGFNGFKRPGRWQTKIWFFPPWSCPSSGTVWLDFPTLYKKLFLNFLWTFYMNFSHPALSPGLEPCLHRVAGLFPPCTRNYSWTFYELFTWTFPTLLFPQVWNRASTVWPDFSHPRAVYFWARQFVRLHQLVPFDGAWIVSAWCIHLYSTLLA